MQAINIQYHKTSYGELILGSFSQKLCICDWRYRKMRQTIDKRITQTLGAPLQEKDDSLIQQTKEQLTEYFAGTRKEFSIPLLFAGSDFQKSVWNALLQVSHGQTSTYAQLAETLGNKNAVRAVANANGANAISILVPCHRIIGSNGELVGYAGGLKAKEKLLQLEQSLFAF